MRAQRGGVVLASVTMVLMLVVVYQLYFSGAFSQREVLASGVDSDLAFARRALIDYSVNYPSHYAESGAGPGHLPCPDTNGNGSPSLSCSGPASGFLAVDFRAGGRKNISFLERQAMSGEPIVYVLSSAFRYSPAPSGAVGHATIVNSHTRGELQLGGETEIIALLIAPGAALDGQHRGASFVLEDYLEGENADGDVVFARGQGNDRILALRRDDLMPLVERRVLAAVHESMQAYFDTNGHMPWLAPVDSELVQGDSHCVPCQRTGWLATERYDRNAPWPPFSEQSCEDENRSVLQAAPELPIWFVSNYWHRHVWMHVHGDDRDPGCSVEPDPVFDEVSVDALMVSVGVAMLEPEHGLGPQVRVSGSGLEHYLDRASWLGGTGNYGPTLQNSSINDQWSVLP